VVVLPFWPLPLPAPARAETVPWRAWALADAIDRTWAAVS